MKNIVLLVFTSLLLNSCVGVRGNGEVESSNRQVESFTGIKVSGAINVFVRQGETHSLKITADANLLPLIKTSVSGDVLNISTKRAISKYEKLNVYIIMPSLEEIDISGASSLNSEGVLKADELDIEASGASDLNLNIDCEELDLDVSGACDVNLSGRAAKAEMEASGASDIKAYSLKLGEAVVDASGSSDVNITVENKIVASASGASSINYKGNPKEVKQFKSGAASINSK